jgi:hypothetical protein
MPERFVPEPADSAEARRVGFAAGRIADHAARELILLKRAAQEADPVAARQLEYEAGTAHRDSIALTEEHGMDR